VNLEEAGTLCSAEFTDSATAAAALLDQGAARVLVTNGSEAVSDGSAAGILTQTPPQVRVARVTGAGDTFMAAHISAQAARLDRAQSLDRALKAAATYVSGGNPRD
jgi:sugar/nucleoside kinase (ribokinase family)